MLKKIVNSGWSAQVRSKWVNPASCVQGPPLLPEEKDRFISLVSLELIDILNKVIGYLKISFEILYTTLAGSTVKALDKEYLTPNDSDLLIWGKFEFLSTKNPRRPWEYTCPALEAVLNKISGLTRVVVTEHFALYSYTLPNGKKIDFKFISSLSPGNIGAFTNELTHVDLTVFLLSKDMDDLLYVTWGAYNEADHRWLMDNKVRLCISSIRLNELSNFSVNEDKFFRLFLGEKHPLLNPFDEALIILGFFKDLCSLNGSLSYRLQRQYEVHFSTQPDKFFYFLKGIVTKVLSHKSMLENALEKDVFINSVIEGVLNRWRQVPSFRPIRYENSRLFIDNEAISIQKAPSVHECITIVVGRLNTYLDDGWPVESMIVVSLMHSLFLMGKFGTSLLTPAFLQTVSDTALDPNQGFSIELADRILNRTRQVFEHTTLSNDIKGSVLAVLKKINSLLNPKLVRVKPEVELTDPPLKSSSQSKSKTHPKHAALSKYQISLPDPVDSPPKPKKPHRSKRIKPKEPESVKFTLEQRIEQFSLATLPSEWNDMFQSLEPVCFLSPKLLECLKIPVVKYCSPQLFSSLSTDSQQYIRNLCKTFPFKEIADGGYEFFDLFDCVFSEKTSFLQDFFQGITNNPSSFTSTQYCDALISVSDVFEERPLECLEAYSFIFLKMSPSIRKEPKVVLYFETLAFRITNSLAVNDCGDILAKQLKDFFTQNTSCETAIWIMTVFIDKIILCCENLFCTALGLSDSKSRAALMNMLNKIPIYFSVEEKLLDILILPKPSSGSIRNSGFKGQNPPVDWINRLAEVFCRAVPLLTIKSINPEDVPNIIKKMILILSKCKILMNDSQLLDVDELSSIEAEYFPIMLDILTRYLPPPVTHLKDYFVSNTAPVLFFNKESRPENLEIRQDIPLVLRLKQGCELYKRYGPSITLSPNSPDKTKPSPVTPTLKPVCSSSTSRLSSGKEEALSSSGKWQ
jgi:hypothetical protein